MNWVWRLARRPPAGWPTEGDFALSDEAMPEPRAGQVLTRTIYLSLDPYQWGRRRSGAEAVGDVCHGRTVSQVVESRTDAYAPGDYLFNTNGWQLYGLTGEGIDVFGYMFPRKVDPSVAPISTAVASSGCWASPPIPAWWCNVDRSPEKRSWFPPPRAASAKRLVRSPSSTAAGSSALPARPRSATSLSRNSASTPALRTVPQAIRTTCAPLVPMVSISTSRTLADTSSRGCCRC